MATNQTGLGVLSTAAAVVTRLERRSPWLQTLRVRHFDWTRLSLPISAGRQELSELRLVQLSDIHLRRHWEPGFTRLLQELEADPPDLLLLTGDLVDDRHDHRPAMPMVERFLAGLRAKAGIYSILGNHDSYELGEEMRRLGVQVISGEQRIVQTTAGELELIGLPGFRREHLPADFAKRFPARQEDRPRLVLSHYPDHLPLTRGLHADVYLAGHTHGGQVCLPNGFAPIRHDTLPRHQAKGVHRVGRTWLVVSRGLGFSGARVRMFCPPEAIELRLLPAET